MKKITCLISVVLTISLIIGCAQDNIYTIKSLRKYQDKYRVKQVKPVPKELWRSLSNEYVLGQQRTPYLIEGNKSWKPKRYFGNFREGSELEQLQLVLSGMSGSFYYNNFFDGMPAADQDVFKVYYRQNYLSDNIANVVLPNQQTPQKMYRDHKPILQVDNIDYSHKYGGSIMMKFELTDFYDHTEDGEDKDILRTADYGYEFTHEVTYHEGEPNQYTDVYTYDIQDLVIRAYVVPELTHFNPAANFQLNRPSNELHIEISPEKVVAYKNGVIIKNFYDSEDYPIFNEFIGQWEQSLTDSLRASNKTTSLYIFAHAFAHYQHRKVLPPLTDKVTNLSLTDGFFDPNTQLYEGLAVVSWKILRIYIYYGEDGEEEIKLSYRVKYVYGGFKHEITRGTLRMGTLEDSAWIPIGVFNENDLEQITAIEILVKIREEDDFLKLGDEVYKPIGMLFNVDDAVVKPKISSVTLGPVAGGLIILEHQYLHDSYEQKHGGIGTGEYILDHCLYEKGHPEDEDFADGSMVSRLRIVVVKR